MKSGTKLPAVIISVVYSLVSLQLLALAGECPSVLLFFGEAPSKAYAETLLTERLLAGGVNVTYAERAEEVTRQYVVQFHETFANTRSGKMTFSSTFRAGSFSERELAAKYGAVITAAEQYRATRGGASHQSAALSAREYTEFQRQTGTITVDYSEEAEYTDWYNEVLTNREQRAFWETIRTWNADIILLGIIDIVPVGRYGGLVAIRAVVSVRAIDVRPDRPKVLRSLAVVANAVDLSETPATQRAVASAMERVAEELAGALPCYRYAPPPTLQTPLGALGMAVVDVRPDWISIETRDQVRAVIEAALSRYPDFTLFTRSELEAVLTEQRFGLSGLVESPVEAGRLAGVRYLLLARITELDWQDQDYYIDFPILNYLRITIRNMRVGLSVSLIDAQSGQIIWSSERARSAWGLSIIGIEFNMRPLDQFRQVARELVDEMYEAVVRRGSGM